MLCACVCVCVCMRVRVWKLTLGKESLMVPEDKRVQCSINVSPLHQTSGTLERWSWVGIK